MFEKIKKLCSELKVDIPTKNKDKMYTLSINDELDITIYDKEPYIFLKGNIIEMIDSKKEDLLIYLMRANLINQGTGGSKIGLSEDGKFLTLLYTMNYEIEYKEFRNELEDFVNYINFYKSEVEKYKEKMNLSIL
ncbi:MAG: hypothetical protein K1060chlam5_00385 [Candidatus Anoxychlamydiales bacterium]|nr:hypothetical protein [Candidatus Anoxychlamydiales bacterium]